jgi:CHAD domain-containing protein
MAIRESLTSRRRDVDFRALRQVSRVARVPAGASPAGVEQARLLASRLILRANEVKETVTTAGVLYMSDRLHAVRIATKKLRYALEPASELGLARAGKLVRELRRMQDGLGLLHDLKILQRSARGVFGSRDVPADVSRLEGRTLALLDERIRARHADYLAHRDRVAEAAGRTIALARTLLSQA